MFIKRVCREFSSPVKKKWQKIMKRMHGHLNKSNRSYECSGVKIKADKFTLGDEVTLKRRRNLGTMRKKYILRFNKTIATAWFLVPPWSWSFFSHHQITVL